jgi:hypothetical protein
MPDRVDWTVATWEGSRRRQHLEFLALPFREKLAVVEEMADLVAFFTERRRARGLPVREPGFPMAKQAVATRTMEDER